MRMVATESSAQRGNVKSELRVLARLMTGKPIFLGFNITNTCNLRCAFCSVPSLTNRDMTLPEIEHAANRIKELGIPVVGITGGEPFMRRDLSDIVGIFAQRDIQVTITSNGELLSRKRIEELARHSNILQFALSLDSLDRETYARIRGKDILPKVLEQFTQARDHGPSTVYKINVVLGPDNVDEVDDFVAFVEASKLYASFIPMNIAPGGLHRGKNYDGWGPAGRERVAGAFEHLRALKLAGAPLWDHRDFYRFAQDYVLGRAMPPCRAGQLFLDLRSDGKLAFCNETDHFIDLLETPKMSQKLLEEKRKEWFPVLDACRLDGACCYTCSYNITATAHSIPAYVWDYFQLRYLGA